MRVSLLSLSPGQRGRVEAIEGDPALVQRLMEFGLCEGEEVEIIAFAPLGDPLEIQIGNTRLSLRRNEANGITITLLTQVLE